MSDVNAANITQFFEELRTDFLDGLNAAQTDVVLRQIAMVVPSKSSVSRHAWLNQIPQIREWVGDRVVQNIESDVGTVTNKKYESTIEMKRTEIEDDEHGVYRNLARIMGDNAAKFPDKALVDELVANNNWIGDSTSFFSASRTYGSNTIDNTTTTAFDATEFQTGITAMSSYLGHNDMPLEVEPKILLYGPSLRTTVFDVLQNDLRASSSAAIKNPDLGLVTPIMSKRLVGTYASYWFLLGEASGIRGLIWQERLAPEFQTSRLSNDSDFVFEQDKFQFGTRQRGRAFLSLPHLIYGGLVP